MFDYETRRDMIVTNAWETWTKNGLRMDDEMRAETTKTVQDAVNNTYHDEISDSDWLAAALKRLGQWRNVYLDNARPADMTPRQFAWHLSALAKAGLYRAIDSFAFGDVRIDGWPN